MPFPKLIKSYGMFSKAINRPCVSQAGSRFGSSEITVRSKEKVSAKTVQLWCLSLF